MNATKGKSGSTAVTKKASKGVNNPSAKAANGSGGSGAARVKRSARKGAKDPNAPKRPMSAYFLFSNEMRDTVRAEQPDLKFTEVAKELGKRWAQMSDQMKDKYQKLAALEKKRYEEQKSQYLKA